MSKKEQNAPQHIKRTTGDWIFDIAVIIFFCIFTFICIFPFYYLLINTISDNDLVTSGRVNFFPMLKNAEGNTIFGVQVNNYVALQNVQDLGSSVLVTVARTLLGTALMVITSAWAGYLVTKQKMWKRSFWYRFLVVTMYFNAGLVPWYMNMLMMGLTDNFLAYIIPGMVAPYNIILVKTYIESIPSSLEESAVIDGASTLKVWLKIILPLSVPILATIAIFAAVNQWNSFQDNLLLITNRHDELDTLQYKLFQYISQANSLKALVSNTTNSNAVMAGLATAATATSIRMSVTVVVVLPVMLIYPFFQRFFTKGIMIGAVKG